MSSLLKNNYDLVVALDPATASFGFAVFDTRSMEVVTVKEFKALGTDLRVRIKSMTLQLAQEFKKLEAMNVEYIIFCEQFVMVGKGGEALQRMIGAAMAISPGNRPFEHVNNLQVKAFVGGTGKADKAQVAAGLRQFFPNDEIVEELIGGHRYDATDALAIGVTGYEKYVVKSALSKKKTKTRKKLNRGKNTLKKSSSKAIQPWWAKLAIDPYEVAQSLLDTVQRHTDYNVDPTIELFNDDLELISALVAEHLDPEFIDAYINTEFGKGILVGLLMNHLNDHYADSLEETEE